MDEKTEMKETGEQGKRETEGEKDRPGEKEHVYACRSCGATAPKKKGLCRPEKIRKGKKEE